MLIIPIMVIIGLAVGNHLWLYLALGLAVLGSSVSQLEKQSKKQTAADLKTQAQSLEDFLKAIQAKLN